MVRASLRPGEAAAAADYKLCANWVINEVLAKRNADNLPPGQFAVGEGTLGYLLQLLRAGDISARTAKDLFAEFWEQSKAGGFVAPGGSTQQVDELIAFFLALTGGTGGQAEFRRRFDLMALQRNLKALGTFGYMTTSRNNTVYIQYIPRTVAYVKANLAKYPRFERLRHLLDPWL